MVASPVKVALIVASCVLAVVAVSVMISPRSWSVWTSFGEIRLPSSPEEFLKRGLSPLNALLVVGNVAEGRRSRRRGRLRLIRHQWGCREELALIIRLLGAFEVTAAGRTLALGATKQRAVLAMLALQANRVVSVDSLVTGLWQEAPPSAVNAVQVYVCQLRRKLQVDAGSDEG